MNKIIYLTLIACTFLGCQTTITPELSPAENILVVDAWINQKMERQSIKITRSQPYFENSAPVKIDGAIVLVKDLTTGTNYEFKEGLADYFWDPVSTPFGIVGHHYQLTVTVDGETFEAFARLGRVPRIDSIKFAYNPDDLLIKKEYYTAEFNAIEPEGVGDTYWIKAWKNGVYLNKPSELNMAYDASFTPGQSVDGQQFIIPLRKTFINPLDENPLKENEFIPPYLVGDSVHIEIHSIDPLAFEFLFAVYFQINRPGGFAELFSMPLANTITNIKSADPNSTTNVAGFFNVSAVSSRGQKLTQEIATEAKQNPN